MINTILLKTGDFDWLATRQTPRKLFPPTLKKEEDQAKKGDLTAYDLNPKPIHEIFVPGAQGIGVRIGKYGKERCLMLHLALPSPFNNNVLSFAEHSLCKWNSIFNTWDMPILSQIKKDALNEIWAKVEDAFFEIPWYYSVIELHWEYAISERDIAVLKKRIDSLNNLWDKTVPIIQYPLLKKSLVVPGLSEKDLLENAINYYRQAYPQSSWNPELASLPARHKLCVNWLRHRYSAYHILLESNKPYLAVFTEINDAIAEVYPQFKEETNRQNQQKKRGI